MRRGDRGIRGSEGKKRGCAEGVAWREGVVGSMGGQATPEFEISHPQSMVFMALHRTRIGTWPADLIKISIPNYLRDCTVSEGIQVD